MLVPYWLIVWLYCVATEAVLAAAGSASLSPVWSPVMAMGAVLLLLVLEISPGTDHAKILVVQNAHVHVIRPAGAGGILIE